MPKSFLAFGPYLSIPAQPCPVHALHHCTDLPLQVLFPDLNLLNRSSGRARVDVQSHSHDKSTLMIHPNLDQGHHCHYWGYDKLIHVFWFFNCTEKTQICKVLLHRSH